MSFVACWCCFLVFIFAGKGMVGVTYESPIHFYGFPRFWVHRLVCHCLWPRPVNYLWKWRQRSDRCVRSRRSEDFPVLAYVCVTVAVLLSVALQLSTVQYHFLVCSLQILNSLCFIFLKIPCLCLCTFFDNSCISCLPSSGSKKRWYYLNKARDSKEN